ncbi:hypothetical protein [Labrys monachus]|uniref:DUF304 domain-containing protein n=1 Tax=Labrys monachus TaxID=217067 RepID=A0ABU0FP14_9HYPH|nr:hypothetical protein [Labrys monachus]MDQ0396356.1 hypothetical protein [Labrys monachus]
MSGLLRLNEAGRRAVVRVLAPAEPIVFVTSPDPREAARGAMPTLAAGALIAGLSAPIAWVCFHAVWQAATGGASLILPLLFGSVALPAFLLGLYLVLAPWAAYRRAQDSVLLITDRRLLMLSVRTGAAEALPARAILGVERKSAERGFGTLEIRHEARGDEAETILTGIDNVLDAELAIRRLSLDHTVTIITPVH